MFQFPGLAPRLLGVPRLLAVGCPIRVPADRFVFANPRRFSQLVAPFFASESQGIPRTPFVTFFSWEPLYSLSNPFFCYSVIRIFYNFLPLSFSHHAKELLLFSFKLLAFSLKCADNEGIEPYIFGTSLIFFSLKLRALSSKLLLKFSMSIFFERFAFLPCGPPLFSDLFILSFVSVLRTIYFVLQFCGE